MGAPTVPYYGKDSDRLAMLGIAYNVLMDTKGLLDNWPNTVVHPTVFKQHIDVYDINFKEGKHGDRRTIAQRIEACNRAGTSWQRIVNYLCATEEDHTETLVRMGAMKSSRSGSPSTSAELYAPDLAVVNLHPKGTVRASCTRERRRYTYDVWVTEGDPRMEEGWYHKASFGDCTQMDMDGYQPGKEYSFRCRIIGRDNKVGPWSLAVTMMVT